MTAHSKNELKPFIPLLVGQGKLAKHLSTYLTQKSIPHERWSNARDLTSPELKLLLNRVTAVWILVSDSAIAEVAQTFAAFSPHLVRLHSSAATEVSGSLTVHPLQTFGPETYLEADYQKIPLILMREEWSDYPELEKSLTLSLGNPIVKISSTKRALYHAYCVMMANFPQLLWSEVTRESEVTLAENRGLFAPILIQATQNFITQGPSALTGPLVRGDQLTLERHLNALKNSALLPIYQAFVNLFKKSAPTQNKEIA